MNEDNPYLAKPSLNFNWVNSLCKNREEAKSLTTKDNQYRRPSARGKGSSHRSAITRYFRRPRLLAGYLKQLKVRRYFRRSLLTGYLKQLNFRRGKIRNCPPVNMYYIHCAGGEISDGRKADTCDPGYRSQLRRSWKRIPVIGNTAYNLLLLLLLLKNLTFK